MSSSRYRLIRATFHTVDGLKVLWKNEQAFRQEIYLCVVLIPACLMLHISDLLKLFLVLLLLFLVVVEIINSALEAVVDRISLENHVQSKIAKDMGSAAVGIAIIMNIIAWVYAIYQHVSLS